MSYERFKKISKLFLILYLALLGIAWIIFTPFQEYTVVESIIALNQYEDGNMGEFLKQLAVILVAMLPIGILVPFSKGHKCRNRTYCIGITVIALAECSRFIYFGGTVCLDEILVAFLGVVIGYAIHKPISKIVKCGSRFQWIKENKKKGWIVYLLAIIALVVVSNNINPIKDFLSEKKSELKRYLVSEIREKDDNEKTSIYYVTYDALRNHQASIEYTGIKLDYDEIHSEFERVLRDHPELFWVTGGGQGMASSVGVMQVYWFRPEIYGDIDEVPQKEAAMMACVDDLIAKCPDGSEYDKARWVHDVLVTNVEYDENVYYSNIGALDENVPYDYAYTAYGALINRKAVCAGYSKAYQLILNRMGIECGCITGTAVNELGPGPHAWNYVRLDGDYYLVDVTWDDPIGPGNTGNTIRHDYFAITDQEMSRNHTPDSEQDIPKCAGKIQ